MACTAKRDNIRAEMSARTGSVQSTSETRAVAVRTRIEPQSGAGMMLRKGSVLRVIDVQGEQVSDLIAFAASDPNEWLSSGRSIDYAGTICFTKGHTLYSNRSNK